MEIRGPILDCLLLSCSRVLISMRTGKNAMPDLQTPTLPFLNLVLDLPIDMLKLCYSRREEQLKSR